MPDPLWPSSPPEANHLRLVGPGAAGTATTLASAAAWQALMAGHEVAAAVSTMNTAATALNFEGVGGAASATTATGLNGALHLLAGWAQQKPPIAASAVAAYETAVSTMIPAEVSLANRSEHAADVALNPLVFGALTPAIVALDLIYFGEHWPHNAGAGAAYGSALTALLPALAVPPPLAPPGASPAAPAAAAAAVAETAGQAAAGEALTQTGQIAESAADSAAVPAEAAAQVGQLASLMQPALGMFQAPMQTLQGFSSGLSGLPQSMLGQLNGLAGAAIPGQTGLPVAALAAGAPGGLGALGGVGGAGGGLGTTGSVGAAGTAGAVGGAGPGSVGAAGVGGVPGAGLTSYTRPTSTFASDNGGRPVGLKSGSLGPAEVRPATTTTGGAVPVTPAGMLGQGKGGEAKDSVVHARVLLAGDRQQEKLD